MFSLHIQLVSMWRASEGVETEMCFCLLYAFFCVIPQRLNFVCRHFGTLCLFHLHRRVGVKNSSYLPAYEDGTDRVFRNVGIQNSDAGGNYPEEIIPTFRTQRKFEIKNISVYFIMFLSQRDFSVSLGSPFKKGFVTDLGSGACHLTACCGLL